MLFPWEADSFQAVVLSKFTAGRKLPAAADGVVTVLGSKLDIT